MKAGILIKSLALIAVLLIAGNIQAQFGVGARYSTMQNDYWQEVFNNGYSDQFVSGYGLYWFRLKNKRIEFLPEVGYYRSFNNASLEPGLSADLSAYYVQFNTDIYFLDLDSDCNCPTFSKQGDLLQRGLFLEISPGVEFRKLSYEIEDLITGNQIEHQFSKTTPKVYGGLGFDIGVSDLITVTPYAGVTYVMGTAWEEAEEMFNVNPSSISETGRNRDVLFNGGIRILFRPDYLYKRR